MCSPAVCRTCGKRTWTGCGMHAEEVMRDVPPEQQCSCHEAPTQQPATSVTPPAR